MGDRRMSGRELARMLGRSEKYVRERLNDTFAFGLNDIETFCAWLGESPEAFLARSEQEAKLRNAGPVRTRRGSSGASGDTIATQGQMTITKPSPEPMVGEGNHHLGDEQALNTHFG